MFGNLNGYAPPAGSFAAVGCNSNKQGWQQPQMATVFSFEQKPITMEFACQEPAVDISLDLLQYMSSVMDVNWATQAATCDQQPHKAAAPQVLPNCPSAVMGSSCSTQSDHMLPDSPVRRDHPGQQRPCKRCCLTPNSSSGPSSRADAPATTSSASSSSSCGEVQEVPASPETSSSLPEPSSSSLAYDDDFVWQCYFGDPNSPANQERQRPKSASPFAVFASFPGFSL